jgi:hypothetical protein
MLLLNDMVSYFQHLNPIRELLALATTAAALIALYYEDKAEKEENRE